MTAAEFKQKAEDIRQVIDRAENILLHLHPSPDPDSAGSTLAMAEYCEGLGKKVTVIGGDSDLSQTMSVLPGFSRILPKAYGDIDTSTFDLFLCLDSGAPTMVSKKSEVSFPETMTVVNIDHHQSNPSFGHINLVDTEAPSAAHIVIELLLEWKADITPTMAENLYAGLHSDTGGFRYERTNARTLELAALMLAANPGAPRASLAMGRMFPKGLIAYKALALSATEEIAGGKAAIIALEHEKLERAGIKFSDTEAASLSQELISVKDWLAAATLIEKEPGRVRVSLRSKEPQRVDVSEVAVSLGGGGHPAAAGILILSSLAEAKKMVTEAIEKALTASASHGV